jgi:hypothetical protein
MCRVAREDDADERIRTDRGSVARLGDRDGGCRGKLATNI